MKTDIKSYSQAVASSSPMVSLAPKTLKKTVKDVVEESDRSRNISWSLVLLKKRKITLSVNREMCSKELGEKPCVVA